MAVKTYIVTFRRHKDRRPSKFIVMTDSMREAIDMGGRAGFLAPLVRTRSTLAVTYANLGDPERARATSRDGASGSGPDRSQRICSGSAAVGPRLGPSVNAYPGTGEDERAAERRHR